MSLGPARRLSFGPFEGRNVIIIGVKNVIIIGVRKCNYYRGWTNIFFGGLRTDFRKNINLFCCWKREILNHVIATLVKRTYWPAMHSTKTTCCPFVQIYPGFLHKLFRQFNFPDSDVHWSRSTALASLDDIFILSQICIKHGVSLERLFAAGTAVTVELLFSYSFK